MSEGSIEPRQLRWRCRRGMLELDVMLTRFVDRVYGLLNQQQRQDFDRLLDAEDDRLWDWLSGREQHPTAGMAELIEWIRTPDND